VSRARRGWLTLKELDQGAGRPKGTAFRAFKRLEPGWREGEQFEALREGPGLAALRAGGRLYAASRVGILLSPAAAAAVREALG
jgi:hypothetical protein